MINQRVFGHLSFENSFRVSQTKDLIIFEGDEETVINEKLKEISQEAMNKAEGGEPLWWSSESQSPKLPPVTKEETDEVRNQLEKKRTKRLKIICIQRNENLLIYLLAVLALPSAVNAIS